MEQDVFTARQSGCGHNIPLRQSPCHRWGKSWPGSRVPSKGNKKVGTAAFGCFDLGFNALRCAIYTWYLLGCDALMRSLLVDTKAPSFPLHTHPWPSLLFCKNASGCIPRRVWKEFMNVARGLEPRSARDFCIQSRALAATPRDQLPGSTNTRPRGQMAHIAWLPCSFPGGSNRFPRGPTSWRFGQHRRAKCCELQLPCSPTRNLSFSRRGARCTFTKSPSKSLRRSAKLGTLQLWSP